MLPFIAWLLLLSVFGLVVLVDVVVVRMRHVVVDGAIVVVDVAVAAVVVVDLVAD